MNEQGTARPQTVIIGASHAGVAAAEQLRGAGYVGGIVILDRLAGQPLERPPLSKAFLQNTEQDDAKFRLRRDEWFAAQDVTLIDGHAVTQIDAAGQTVRLDDRREWGYDNLILATGAVPRQLAAAQGLDRVFVLRDPTHARQLRAAMATSRTAIVIGGGYIGLEAAASMAKAGITVHVIEMAPRLLARVASPQMSDFFASLQQSYGVHIHTGQQQVKIMSKAGGFTGVDFGNGTVIAGDLLLVGIGVVPDTGLAVAAGLDVDNGIVVDARMRTSVPHIYAIGDAARRDDRAVRIESVDNAQCGAAIVAATICGIDPPPVTAPWFWSEQFDVRLQSAGLVPPPSASSHYIVRPGKRDGGFSVWSFDDKRLIAVEAVRDPASYMLGKTCLDRGLSPDLDKLGDPVFDLKAFVAGDK